MTDPDLPSTGVPEGAGETERNGLGAAQAGPDGRDGIVSISQVEDPAAVTPRGWYVTAYSVVRRLAKGWLREPLTPLLTWLQSVMMAHQHLAFERGEDHTNPQTNVVVPDGERVTVAAFWVVDYFSPSYAAQLEERLRRPEWQRPLGSSDRTSPVTATRLSREHASPVNVRELGSFIRKTSDGFALWSTRRELPTGIRAVTVKLVPMGPALSAVVATFYPDEELSHALNDALKADHEPRLRREAGTLQVSQRLFTGIETVRLARESLHKIGRDWLSAELPGIFATEAGRRHPVLDLILTEDFDPMKNLDDAANRNMLRALGCGMGWTRHTSFMPAAENVRLFEVETEQSYRTIGEPEWMLWAKTSSAFGNDDFVGYYGGRSPETIARRLADPGVGLVSRLGLFELAQLKTRSAARARDSAHRVHSGRPVATAKRLRTSLLTTGLDMSTIADSVTAFTQDTQRYEWQVPRVVLRHSHAPEAEREPDTTVILQQWATAQRKAFKRLRDEEQAMLPILSTVASLSAAISGTRTQRWALGVAILSLVASGVAVYFAYLAIVVAQASQVN
ncbi:hypothetical protein [Microbacterium sp. NPDC056736]|uniref:hypothetical protein n=1 Tax=Microbacterium sp. NPDC056736 TaxID=3345932 RepID=UPI0036707E07